MPIVPASGDASFRRYYRIDNGASSRIVMDAPPELEDSRSFVQIAGYLESMQINSPRVMEGDLENGFLLLTDLGSTQYLDELRRAPESAEALYADAIAALATIQSRGVAFQGDLPTYDTELLQFELSLFRDWLCGKHLGITFNVSEQREWHSLCELLVDNALSQPQVFVHRDYHSRNLMVTDTDNPGILDFQGAVEGPLTYDLVSLLKDCYISWPAETILERARDFHRQIGDNAGNLSEFDNFWRRFELMGVQRQLKAAGIFARLKHRDGKPHYLPDVPRTLRYIVDLASRYESLSFFADFIAGRILPGLAGAGH